MPTDVVERVHATQNSGVEQSRNYRVGVWIPPWSTLGADTPIAQVLRGPGSPSGADRFRGR